jgi:hypothetical protein
MRMPEGQITTIKLQRTRCRKASQYEEILSLLRSLHRF